MVISPGPELVPWLGNPLVAALGFVVGLALATETLLGSIRRSLEHLDALRKRFRRK